MVLAGHAYAGSVIDALDQKPAFAAVAATNATINGLAKVFAEQGIRDGVQVNSIVPGAVITGPRKSLVGTGASTHMTVEEATEQFPEKAGMNRYGCPEEIADLFAFMVSPVAKWMTGTSVRMDGGEIEGMREEGATERRRFLARTT